MSLEEKVEGNEFDRISAEPIKNIPRQFALSFSQRRLWFLDQLDPQNPVYNICTAERIKGQLNLAALEASLVAIVERHAILRTSFPTVDGEPFQIVSPDTHSALERVDLSHLSIAQKQAEVTRIVTQEARTRFDMAQGPLFRARLLVLSSYEFVWLFIVHQMIWDGWSFKVFYRELASFYESYVTGKPAVVPELPLQFADYAVREREELQGERHQKSLSFWRQTLYPSSHYLSLPTDHPRLPRLSYHGIRRSVAFPEPLTKGLKELSRRQRATLFMTLLTAFATLLSRYSGQTDIVVGCPVANRNHPEIENLIGSFVNTLALKTRIDGDSSFVKLLSEIRASCLAAFSHQEFPFEKLVEELHPERSLNQNPLFQVFFAFQQTPPQSLSLTGVSTEPLEVTSNTSKFDLTLSLTERNRKLVGFFEYTTDLFESTTIERMATRYKTLLEAVLANPEQRIATLPILTDAERHQILVEWNDTAADYSKDKCIPHLFEEPVDRTPDAIALEFEDQQITYRELNQRANQLAHYLITLGIGPEKLVGICIERSIEMMVGLLGTLKAGGAYVPLDPAYPKERLRFMLEDSQVSVLLTREKLVEEGGWRMDDGDPRSSIFDLRFRVVCLDRDSHLIAQQSSENPSSNSQARNLAYVIYTSGSTGKPKGVQIEHRSVVNCLTSIGKQIDLKQQDAWLAVTTISFDIAALELFLPLITGAKLVLSNTEESGDVTKLIGRIKTSRPSVMQATPSMWQLLFEAGWQCPAGFTILSGGEALARPLANRFLDSADSLWNLYGPTESTIWSTMARVTANETAISIGRPVDNTQIYILDAHLQPLPIGIPGELYIAGDGLARGYLNRPELTAEKFIRNPFSHDSTSRLYRTGDLAKYRADGNIEFLGRNDNQVKIRGHRIELGEIEGILNQHPSVKEAVIVARVCGSSEENELAAYVVGSHESAPTVAELRRFLQEKLPQFMIPSVFIFLGALPLTANGKIDRHALPPPDGERTELDHGFVEPRTETEELVAQIWRDVLKRDRVGVYDNFFELGGHSLLATRVVARLQRNFHVDLPLRKLFEHPTVAGLAQHIETLRRSSAGTAIAPMASVPRVHPLPLSFSQRRLWYLQKVDPNLSAYNIPAAFRILGGLDSTALERALNEMIARHEILRSCIKEIEGQPRQESAPALRISLPMIDLTDLSDQQAEAEANRLFHADTRQLYDLGNPPLLRAKLVKLAADDHILIVNFHHLIADGFSLAIFHRELGLFYDAARDGKTASLPPLPVQYADFAAWQQEWLKSDTFDVQIAYWKRQLADLPAPVELPNDFDRPARLSYRGARLTWQLSEASTVSLKNFSRQHGATMFMTLFATFNILLSRITGRDDIVVGSTIAGRNRPETEGLIGFFINALPIRSDLSGDPHFTTLLQRVREVCLDAYDHQEIPFEKIVEELRPARDPGHNPIFDILFRRHLRAHADFGRVRSNEACASRSGSKIRYCVVRARS